MFDAAKMLDNSPIGRSFKWKLVKHRASVGVLVELKTGPNLPKGIVRNLQ